MRQYPGVFSIYKKLGAAQFTIIPPREGESGRIKKNGAVLLEVAAGSGNKSYSWTDKITFALGMNDLCNWFTNPDAPPKLIHQMPDSPVVKTLEVTPGDGKYAGTFMLKLGENNKSQDKNKYVSVPITGGEYTVLLRLFMSAAPKIIGWD